MVVDLPHSVRTRMSLRKLVAEVNISFKYILNGRTNILGMKHVVAWQVPKKLNFVLTFSRFFGQNCYESYRLNPVLDWYGPVCLFYVSEAKIETPKKMFWVYWGHKRKFAEEAKGHINLLTKNGRRIVFYVGIIVHWTRWGSTLKAIKWILRRN